MSSNRELAAWHEAGHASAIKEVSALNGVVEIGDHGNGLTKIRSSWGWNLFVGSFHTREDALTVGIAGCLAESWICRSSVQDLLEAQTFGNGWGEGDGVWETLNGDPLDRWIRKTERLIRGTKREIEVLAEALYEHGRVDGDDARAILSGRY